jgi:hypothetical protein
MNLFAVAHGFPCDVVPKIEAYHGCPRKTTNATDKLIQEN